MAEGRGFEPPVRLRVHLISSQVPLTTQPPFPPVDVTAFAAFQTPSSCPRRNDPPGPNCRRYHHTLPAGRILAKLKSMLLHEKIMLSGPGNWSGETGLFGRTKRPVKNPAGLVPIDAYTRDALDCATVFGARFQISGWDISR